MAIVAAAAAASPISLDCSSSNVGSARWLHSPRQCHRVSELTNISFGRKRSLFGARYGKWLFTEHNQCSTKVPVAADYSDSVPNSSSSMSNKGYHPLEELKSTRSMRETELTAAEKARTTLQIHYDALVVLPGTVHCEPYEQTSWADYRYIVDDFGDLFFEIFDRENILHDREASNPANALIGIDIPTYQARTVGGQRENEDFLMFEDFLEDDDYYEITDAEMSDIQEDRWTTDASSWVHPLHFAKCITKAINAEFDKKMDKPSNGLSVFGCLHRVSIDDESYLRRVFFDGSDGYDSGWKDTEMSSLNPEPVEHTFTSSIYQMEIIRIDLFSIYGVQSKIDLRDFRGAKPDVLWPATSVILGHFSNRDQICNNALKNLCKKKGIFVERANLIGVDSLGMDVRASSGSEVQTYRFPFKSRIQLLRLRSRFNNCYFPGLGEKSFRISMIN
uniref:Uncharacterized protein n=1 Tax=Kalanchoe fedtschenkoi TaxID=63787 RepID=A0A7N0RBY6_KALFE